MKTPSLITDYSKLSEVNLDFAAQTVANSLNGNANFQQLSGEIQSFKTEQEVYHDSLDRAASGDRNFIAQKNRFKANLLASMRQLAQDVEAQANGDRVLLISSGFELASEGDSVPALSTPEDFKISDGLNPGELKFSVRRVPQAASYIHQYTEGEITDESKWISEPSTSREFVFTGLRSGVRIYGRTTAIGRKGQKAVSMVGSRVVQ